MKKEKEFFITKEEYLQNKKIVQNLSKKQRRIIDNALKEWRVEQQDLLASPEKNSYIQEFSRKDLLSYSKYFIPSKKREEVLSDINETLDDMLTIGIPKWKIKIVLFVTILGIIISLFRLRINDYGGSKKKINES